LGDLVHIADGGDSRAEVEKLSNTLLDTESHRPPQECPIMLEYRLHLRGKLEQFVSKHPINLEVTRPT
jgi:hypothetical protein